MDFSLLHFLPDFLICGCYFSKCIFRIESGMRERERERLKVRTFTLAHEIPTHSNCKYLWLLQLQF